MNRRYILPAAAVIIVAGALLAAPTARMLVRIPAVQARLVARGMAANFAANQAGNDLVNAQSLRVILCGTASPIPSATRAGPCALVTAGGHMWLVDAGGGSWRNIMLWHLPIDKLSAVLLTHFHSDHIQDLGEVNMQSWVAGRFHPLPVYGGPGVQQVVDGFTQAYTLDTGYRVTHHGAATLPPEQGPMVAHTIDAGAGAVLHEGQTTTVLDQDGMKITAIGVNHAPISPAYAYRFDYAGRSLVISGDTKPSPAFATAVAGVEVMVHEAQADEVVSMIRDFMRAQGNTRFTKILTDIQSYHTTPAEAGTIANEAGAKLLVLTHLTPALPTLLADSIFLSDAQKTRAEPTLLGHDGLTISLPANGSAIEATDQSIQ